MDFKLWPYGNAHETAKPDGTYEFTCQHGPSECEGNLIFACAINLNNKTVDDWFPFVNCIEGSNASPASSAPNCAKQHNIDYDAVSQCVKGADGNKIMHEIAQRTANLQPPHQWTPWVVVNGKPLSSDDLDKELTDIVCNTYGGTKPAGCSKAKHTLCTP
jgi:interferon gamma-inducible protein 30